VQGANVISTPAPATSRPRCGPSSWPTGTRRGAFAATTRDAVGIVTELNRQISDLEAALVSCARNSVNKW
jgi:hypothetical protein